MSLKKSATRRLSLLAGSSLIAAGLATAAFTSTVLAPTVVRAADECTPVSPTLGNGAGPVSDDPTLNGTTADSFSCADATYATGITYDAFGDLTVSKTNTGTTTVTADGVNLTGDGTEALTWNSTVGGVTGGTGTAGPVISVTSTGSGPITVNTAAVTGTNASVTYGIYAESTGGGDVSVNAVGGTVSATNSTSGIAGIHAASNGGDVTIHQNFTGSAATATGRLYGIRAATTGAGNLSLTATKSTSSSGGNQATTSASGIAAIDASVESGDLLIQVVGSVNNSNATGIGIRAVSRGGDTEIEIIQGSLQAGASSASPASTAIQLDMQGGLATINNLGTGRIGATNSTRRGDAFVRALGDGEIVVNNGSQILGSVQLGAFGGEFTLNNSGPVRGWSTRGQNVFSQGDDVINNLAGGVILTGTPGSNGLSLQNTSLAFGTGEDRINNAGLIVVGENHDTNFNSTVGATLEITGLERFNNSGLIVMGSFERTYEDIVLGSQTDLYYDDVIVMRDGHFHGDEGSRVWLDANLNRTGQTSCARNVEGLTENVTLADPEDGRLRANDCLDFRGSGVSGRTGLIIADVIAGDRGAYNPEGNVVVDLTGSNPADIDPAAFYVAPESAGYSPIAGGFVDKGLFAYTVGYDPEDEAFKIYGVESPSAVQFSLLGQAANGLWRTATSPWLERRGVQRNEEEGGELTPRFWMRGALTAADQAVSDSVVAGGSVLDYDSSFAQKDASLAMGMDLIRATAFGGDWLVGAMAGYAQARLDFDSSVNTATFEGGGVGIYSGLTAGSFFNDVVINATLTNLLIDMPSMNLRPAGTLLESDVSTIGAHMETGLRFALGAMRIEPLASLAWSQTSFDTIDVPADDPLRFGGEVKLDDARSTRAGLGVRFVMRDFAPTVLPVDAHVTARSMHELDGETAVTIVNLGPDANLARTFDGAYNELNAGLAVGRVADHFGAFVNLGGAWGDDYEAKTGSLGLRLRW